MYFALVYLFGKSYAMREWHASIKIFFNMLIYRLSNRIVHMYTVWRIYCRFKVCTSRWKILPRNLRKRESLFSPFFVMNLRIDILILC